LLVADQSAFCIKKQERKVFEFATAPGNTAMMDPAALHQSLQFNKF
jgi:hypothetical protein